MNELILSEFFFFCSTNCAGRRKRKGDEKCRVDDGAMVTSSDMVPAIRSRFRFSRVGGSSCLRQVYPRSKVRSLGLSAGTWHVVPIQLLSGIISICHNFNPTQNLQRPNNGCVETNLLDFSSKSLSHFLRRDFHFCLP